MTAEMIPILRATDGDALAEWYGKLGFEIESEHRFAPTLPLYLILRSGAVRLHLSEHLGDAVVGSLVYVYVSDLDAVADAYSATIAVRPWGREIKLTDPSGNRLRIGEAG